MQQVGYVILFVADLERSTAFYRDVIGVPFKLRGRVRGVRHRGAGSGCTTGTGSGS